MKWLWRLLRDGFLWAVQNPVILLLLLLLLAYNHFAGDDSLFQGAGVNWTEAISIWDFLWNSMHALLATKLLLLGCLGLIGSTLITIFEVGANFALFAKNQKPILAGVKAMFAYGALQYLIYQTLLGGAFLLVFTGLMYVVVFPFGLTGLLGSLIIFLLVVIGYPTFYMLLSTGAVICASRVSDSEKFRMVCITFRKGNFTRLFAFYLLRVGVETGVVSLAILIASYFHVRSGFDVIFIALISILPFAVIRSSGYLLKFEIFKEIPWYQAYFYDLYNLPQA